jgi:hypothetical protein
MSLNLVKKILLLNGVSPLKTELTQNDDGKFWTCSFPGAILTEGREIKRYYYWKQSLAESVNHFFDYVTTPGRTIFVIETGEEFQYNGEIFLHTGGVIKI